MSKKEFYYPSSDGINNIHAFRWDPEGEPVAVLQIVHGMTEFVGRYSDFASFLAEHGFLVVGEDHLGHGGSVSKEEDYGYFGPDGNRHMIRNIHRLRVQTQIENPDIPYFILGHSMGSFLVRQYITEQNGHFAEDLAGAIIVGTGHQSAPTLAAGKTVAKLISKIKGERARSPFIESLAFDKYQSRIENPRTEKDWLTRDEKIVDWYVNEEWCQFTFSVNAYYNMFKGIKKAHDKKRMKALPAGFPILFASGTEDPVGNWGEGVRKTWELYDKNSSCHLDLKLYDGMRHEIINEIGKEEVYDDILTWMQEVIDEQHVSKRVQE